MMLAAMTVLITALATCVAMELYSALAHRFLWHGPLWLLHKSHHASLESTRSFVRNDLLSLAHAPVAMALIAASLFLSGFAAAFALGIGIGMSAYGALYFVFHDGMVHGRIDVAPLLRLRVCRALRAAHLLHHRRPGGPFGFFLSPLFVRGRA